MTGGELCDSARRGWKKIAGGKPRAATGIRLIHDFHPDGVTDHLARIRDPIRNAAATAWTQAFSLRLSLADSSLRIRILNMWWAVPVVALR